MDEDRRQVPGRRASDGPVEERVQAILGVGEEIGGLRTSVETLAAVIGSMATKEDVAAAEARQDRKRRWSVVGVGVVLLFLLAPLVGQFFVLDEVREQGTILVECTTPGRPDSDDVRDRVHECYDEGRARSTALLAEFHLAVLDAATCAVAVPAPEVARCYADRVQARTGLRPDVNPTS